MKYVAIFCVLCFTFIIEMMTNCQQNCITFSQYFFFKRIINGTIKEPGIIKFFTIPIPCFDRLVRLMFEQWQYVRKVQFGCLEFLIDRRNNTIKWHNKPSSVHTSTP